MDEVRPATIDEAAEVLRDLSESSTPVRFRGGGTRSQWGTVVPEPDVSFDTRGLSGIVEHNAGDLTAIVEAGTPLVEAQAVFAEQGQMLALDPPADAEATVGGAIATADSGPLRHRYGGARDLVLGMTVVMSDGTVARSGGKVIKNVAGYDLGKLFCGSFGTLGLVARVALRLHPRPPTTVTASGRSDDPDAIRRAASTLTHASQEAIAIDVAWERGSGHVLARFAGATAEDQARRAAASLGEAGTESEVLDDDDASWKQQRARQRAASGAVVRTSVLQTDLAAVLHVVERLGGSLVGRAGAGLLWIAFPGAAPEELIATIEQLRHEIGPRTCTVFDAPIEVRSKLDVWGARLDGSVDLMRRVKSRFDPAGICNPGIFVGGI